MISTTEIFENISVIEALKHEYRISISFESVFGSIDSVSILFEFVKPMSGFFQVGRFELGSISS